jgi:uncharacterized protein YegP (UPF0339 family)
MSALRFLCVAALAVGFSGLSADAGQKKDKDKSDLKFELYKDKAGEFRWRLKAANGAVLATPGQGYKAAADAKHSIELVQKSGTDDKMKYEFYEDAKKETRWRLKAGNGQVVASSSEGYKTKADAEKAVAHIKAAAAKAEVVELKE